MNIYYVYFYLRPNYTPYYIGKGCNNRAWSRNKNDIKPPKDKSKIILFKTNLSLLESFYLERYFIRWFGRKDLGTGILRNKTDGGEGISSEDSRKIQLNLSKNKTHHFLKNEDGTSVGLKITKQKIENKTHNFQKREDGTSLQTDRLLNKTHHLLRKNDGSSVGGDNIKNRISLGLHHIKPGTIACYNNNGECKQISKDMFYNQIGPKDQWEWVAISSKEGKRRRGK